jgi:hypothetical protein
MKKYLQLPALLSLLFSLIITTAHAQLEHIRYQIPDSLLNDQPFTKLDTSSYLSTGVLWDRTIPNLDFLAYQGYNDGDTAEGLDALQAYLDLYYAALDTTYLQSYDSLMALYDQQRYGFDAIPIMTFAFNYQKLKPNAYTNGLISILDSQIVIANPALNPFETKTLWMAGTRFNEVPLKDTFAVVVSGALFFQNSNAPIDSTFTLQINLDNGMGFQNITLNQKIDVYYSGEGGETKNVQLKWSNTTDTNFANMRWKTANNCANIPPAQTAPWPNSTKDFTYLVSTPAGFTFNTVTRAIKHSIEASIPYQSKKAEGKVYIKYRDGAGANPNTFKKPIIFVEGIDLENVFTGYGRIGYIPFINSTKLGTTGWPQLWGCGKVGNLFKAATPYLNQLTAEGYDIIMLDFFDGDDYIQRNAFLLVELIQRINQNKIGDEGNVILGASMGGQVTRYALSHMEQNNLPHCTRLNISLDSPWKGAHIPMAIQTFLDYATHHHNNALARKKLNQLHNPTPKQLLNYHIWKAKNSYRTISGNRQKTVTFNFNNQLAPCPERLTLMQEFQNMGDYPKQCRNIAILNGKNSGNVEYAGGSTFLEHNNDQCVLFEVQNDLFAENTGLSTVAILNAGMGTKKYWYKVNNMVDIFNASSSWRDDITEIDKGIRAGLREYKCETGSVHIRNQKGVFIPSVSALDVGNNNWHYGLATIDPKKPQTSGLTHFDSYIAPFVSETHVLTTSTNMDYLINEIRKGENVLNTQNGNVLTKAWNNPFENSQVSGLDINQGGILYLNANRGIYEGSTWRNSPPENSLSRVRIGAACSPVKVININQGGILELGSADLSLNINNLAYLQIPDGAELNLNAGGNLTIHPGSKIIVQNGGVLKLSDDVEINNGQIIIEDGGELIYESAANLDFNQAGSSLLIQGKLHMKSGAILSVNSNGKVIFDQDIPWITDPSTGSPIRDIASYLDIEPGAKLSLIGANPSFKNQTILEIRKETIFKDDDQDVFDEVIIQNGAIEIAPQAFLFIASPLNVIDAEIRSSDPSNYHGGLRIWNGNTINYLRRVSIKNGLPGVLVSGIGSAGHTEFRDCNIENNWDGLKWNGGFHKVLNCTFSNNLGHAIYGLNLNGTSEIYNSNFTFIPLANISPSASAIDLRGQEGSLLQVSNTIINGFAQGINLDDIDLRAECNTIQNNYIGIKSNNAMVYLNNDASNVIKYNESVGINMLGSASRGSGLYLLEGKNKFQLPFSNLGLYHHVLGQWECFQPLSDYTANMHLNFNFNDFDIPSSATINSLFSMAIVHCTNPSIYYALNVDLSQNNNSGPTCGTNNISDLHPTHAVLSELPSTSGKVGNGSIFNQTPLYQALDQALTKLSFNENIRNDKEALSDLIIILQSPLTNTDSNSQAYLNLAYRAMHQALNQSYQQNQLTNNEGQSNPPITELSDVCDLVDDLLLPLSPIDSMDHASIFQLNLDKVHAYRVAGHYTEALGVLTNRSNWTFNFTQSQRAGYWDCVCRQEDAYYRGDVPAEEFGYGLDLCRQSYAGYTYKRLIPSKETEETVNEELIEAYPQPVIEILYLEPSIELQGLSKVTILNLDGQTLSNTDMSLKDGRFEINMKHLSSGVYIIRISNNKIHKSFKVLKN